MAIPSIRVPTQVAVSLLLGMSFAAVASRAEPAPPSGPLRRYVPASSFRVPYTLKSVGDADLLLSLGADTFCIESEFSTPEPKWQKGSNRFFRFERALEKRDECVVVRDTFTNLTDENLPLMLRHRAYPTSTAGSGAWKERRLSGLPVTAPSPHGSQPANPTSFGTTEKAGLGLLPLDDIFQVHSDNSVSSGSLGLDDPALVLKPKATHTAIWAIVPTAVPDYFAFVNAVRRLRDVNFRIDGSFAFLRADPQTTGKWTDAELAAFIKNKSAKYLAIPLLYPRYKGIAAHGTAFQSLDLSDWKREVARRKRVAPDSKQLGYFHAFIDVDEQAAQKYASARLTKKDGTPALYSDAQNKLFVPTTSNEYGQAIARNVDLLLKDVGCDGIYWDEMDYSLETYDYAEPWDGASADIDPKTMKITRLKSSVVLLSQPWRIALAKRILEKGPLVGNGAPTTQTMAQLHFPRFTETGAITHCSRVQLYTPIALGDHRTEKSGVDAYRTMLRALDYGCVYYWYNDLTVIPTYPTLTQYMFPITPLELHEGWILGQERILTNRSGVFGWNDGSRHEVHLFDTEGRESTGTKAVTTKQDGKTITELRLPEGWSAAILRKSE